MATTKRGIYHLFGHCKGLHMAHVYNTVLDRWEYYPTVLTSKKKKKATTKRGIYHLLGHCKGRHIAYVYNTVLDRLECYLTVLTSREKYSHKLSLKKNSLKKSKN